MARTSKKAAGSNSAGSRRRAAGSAKRSSSRSSGRASSGARVLVDHDEIRRWAEERNAAPARVRGTGRSADDVGIIRLDFPGYSGGDSLEHISWEEWFEEFDKKKLALLVQDKTARGQKSNFNKLVSRETAMASERGESRASGRTSARAQTAKSSGRGSSKTTAKSARGSARAKRTESVRGRTSSRRRAA
jgi:hypothetical protein